MSRLITAILMVVSFNSKAQSLDSAALSFLKTDVIGDPINLKKLPSKPFEIDTSELFKDIEFLLFQNSLKDLEAMVAKIEPSSRRDSVYQERIHRYKVILNKTKENWDTILLQCVSNNHYAWNQLKLENIKTKRRSSKKTTVNYSLPIFIDDNTLIMYYRYYYDPLLWGIQIDLWEYKDNTWKQSKNRTLIMG